MRVTRDSSATETDETHRHYTETAMSIRTKRPGSALAMRALIALSLSLLLACGGSQKTSSSKKPKGDDPSALPGPPIGEEADKPKKPKREISKDTRSDYGKALTFFQRQESSGWSKSSCESSAKKFRQVSSDHPKLVEAPYMAGLSYHRCSMSKDAEKEYKRALAIDRAHALSMSNLGELYYQSGNADSAKKQWENALKADGKIVAARNNLAWLLLGKLRKTKDRSTWKRVEKQATDQLSRALAVDTENVKTYVIYALVYMEGFERNKSRLDLAKLLLDEGEKRNKEFAPLHNARGLLQIKRKNLGLALKSFRRAVQIDSGFVEARMNVGNITLGFRKYDTAQEQFTKVLQLKPKSYNAIIGLGVAQRGLGNLDAAEASYNKAIEVDSRRGAAYFNLGVLYKDFRANAAEDVKQSQTAYKKAQGYFNSYMSKSDASTLGKREAKDNISDCKKIIRQLDDVIKAMARDSGSK